MGRRTRPATTQELNVNFINHPGIGTAASRRKARELAEATCDYSVRALRKDGKPSAVVHSLHSLRADAQAEADRMTNLNPGSTYLVCI